MDQKEYIPDSQTTFGIASEVIKNNFVRLAAVYLIGVVPFMTFMIYFVLELSYSGNAEKSVLLLTSIAFILFCWMKVFQSIFTTNIYYLLQEELPPVSFGFKEVFYQICLQASSLFVYLVGFVVFFSLQVSYNFYSYALIVTNEKQKMDFSARLKNDWKKGNGMTENAKLTTYFFGVCFFVFLNVVSLIAMLPSLLQTFFGIETIFLKSQYAFFNLITIVIICNFTYLLCDPFFKGAYAVRCYYKNALPKGGDLQYRLKKIFTVAIIIIVTLFMPTNTKANETTRENLQEVLSQKKYQWREGKKFQIPEINESFRDKIKRFFEWLSDLIYDEKNEKEPNNSTWSFNGEFIKPVITLLIIVFLSAIIIIIIQNLRLARRLKEIQEKKEVQVPIIKKPEEDKYDEFGEDEWAKAARELVSKGDYRGAIRALYYQVLMSLGEKNLLLIQRYKTNSQYRSELKNRAHRYPRINDLFIQSIIFFEEAWFSNKSVQEEDFNAANAIASELKGQLNA